MQTSGVRGDNRECHATHSFVPFNAESEPLPRLPPDRSATDMTCNPRPLRLEDRLEDRLLGTGDGSRLPIDRLRCRKKKKIGGNRRAVTVHPRGPGGGVEPRHPSPNAKRIFPSARPLKADIYASRPDQPPSYESSKEHAPVRERGGAQTQRPWTVKGGSER